MATNRVGRYDDCVFSDIHKIEEVLIMDQGFVFMIAVSVLASIFCWYVLKNSDNNNNDDQKK